MKKFKIIRKNIRITKFIMKIILKPDSNNLNYKYKI